MKILDIPGANLEEIDDKELLSLHRRLHQLAGALFPGPKERAEDEDEGKLTWEDLVNSHALIVAEMEAREMNHNVHDRLDKETNALKSQDIMAKLAELPEEVMVVPNFVAIVGSAATGDEDPGDIDVLFRADRDKTGKYFLIQADNIWLPVRKVLDPEKKGILHFIDGPQGSHADYIPCYSLVLRREKPVRQVVKHLPGQHDQKTHGHRRGGRLLRDIERSGGFTYQPITGDTPKEGFALSIYPEHEKVISADLPQQEKARLITQYIKDKKEIWSKPDHYVGGWHDTESGKIYLDVSIITRDNEVARKLAIQHGQEGYYDLGKGETIIVKRPEERRKAAGEEALEARDLAQESDGQGYQEFRQRSSGRGRIEVEKEAIQPVAWYTPSKPAMIGYTEFFSADELWEKWASEQDVPLYISPKVDGFRCILQKSGDEISIYFEDSKEERSDRLPSLKNVLMDAPDCIIEGELQAAKDGKFLARPQVFSVLSGELEARPYVFLYDLLYLEPEGDVHERPFSERYELLKSLGRGLGEDFVVLPQVLVKGEGEFKRAAREMASWQPFRSAGLAVEGVIARRSDMPYTFGATDDYAKYKIWVELKVKVLKVERTANGYVYECALRDDETKKDVPLGKTFVSKGKLANEDDTLNVMVEELLLYPDGKVSWGKPYPMGPDRSRPAYTVAQAVDIARRGRVLKEITEKEAPGEEGEGETRGERAEKFWQENWHKLYPKSGKGRFVLHEHWRGLSEDEVKLSREELIKRGHSLHSDLRLESDGVLHGWTVFLGKAEENAANRLIALPPDDNLQVVPKLGQPKGWLTFEGVSEPGGVGATTGKYARFDIVDSGTYEAGVWREHAMEYFFYGKKLKGRLLVQYAPLGGRRVWIIDRPEDQRPYAETHDLEDVVKELKDKGQKWLIWRKPGEKPQLVNAQEGVSKHLPGRHDQKTHGHRYTARGGIDVTKSPAIQRALNDAEYRYKQEGSQDLVMRDLCKEAGFTGKPKVVSKEELDARIASGEQEMFRGVSREEYVNAYTNGEYFAGTGFYGSGTYTVTGEMGLPVAETYAGPGGSVMRMSLAKNARVIEYDKIREMQKTELESIHRNASLKAQAILRRKGETPEAVKEANRILDEAFNLTEVLLDPGRFAVVKGYDAISVPSRDFIVVYNRSKVTVQRGDPRK